TVRRLLRPRRSSNPVWTRLRSGPSRKISRSQEHILRYFSQEIQAMIDAEPEGRPAPRSGSPRIDVREASSTRLPLQDRSVGLILTSPPYCTRLDYAVATLPELLVLGYAYSKEFRELRESLIGTTTVPRTLLNHKSEWGPTVTEFLERLR